MVTVSGTNIDEIPDIIDIVVAHDADVFAFADVPDPVRKRKWGLRLFVIKPSGEECDRKFQDVRGTRGAIPILIKDHLWTLYGMRQGQFQDS